MYELIVFDWDGTLMDSEATIVSCLQMAARDLEIVEPEPEQARDVIGLGLHQALASLFPQSSDAEVDVLAQQYRKHFLREDREPSPLFPGVRELLEQLASMNYFLAVATGKSRQGLDMELEHSGLGGVFQATRCADEAFSKPHPQLLLDVLDHLGVASRQALVIGDTEYDMQMAANAGSDAIGVSFGVHSPERLREHGALTVVEHLAHIPDWLVEPGKQ